MGGFHLNVQFDRLLYWLLFIGGLAGVIYPAFLDHEMSLTQLVLSLFRWDPSFGWFMRWLAAVGVVCSAFILTTHQLYRGTPITAMRTDIRAYFEGQNTPQETMRVDREQFLRANQPRVTAHFSHSIPHEKGATITEISAKLHSDPKISCAVEKRGSPEKGYEIVQNFERNLPSAWYMFLMPPMWFNTDYANLIWPIRKNVVVRKQTTVYRNEFSEAHGEMNFTVNRYPLHHFHFTLDFGDKPIPEHFRALRMRANAIESIPPEPHASKNIASVYIPRVQNETIRITWIDPETLR